MSELQRPADCECSEWVYCRRTYSNGLDHIAKQCLTCGRQIELVKRSEFTIDEINSFGSWDEGIRKRYQLQRTAQWEAYNEIRDAERSAEFESRLTNMQEEYADYRQTAVWRKKRDMRLRRDGWQCQAQMIECTDRATEVHHLSYRYIGNEPQFDLISVCRSCHAALSKMEGRIDRDAA